jgi:VWFA-related protein
MTRLYAVILALFLCFPALAFTQQSSAPAGTAPQTAPPPASSDPVLVNRPPPRPPKPLSAITAEGRIHLDFLVSDVAGKPVLGLEPADFKLLDNNQPRKILSFRSFDGVTVKPDPPVEIILLFDTVNLPVQQVAFARQEMAKFLRQNGGHLAQPVSIMLLSEDGLRVQPHPSVDGNALVSVLDQVKGGIHTINSAMGAAGDLERFQLSLRQMAVIAENEATRPGRKLLIWVGPGWPMLNSNDYRFTDKDQRHYFDTIVELSTKLREARIVVYSVAPANVESTGERRFMYQDFLKGVTSPRKADTGNLALKVLALQSGGRILGPDNNLAEQIDGCIADASAFYTISFNPPAVEHADEYHDLKIEVSQPGLVTRTTSGYYNQPPAVLIDSNGVSK